ncbi:MULTISPECIES: GNAT family acetyltransferase [unclassified Streptomyces]|uniref:GNAT family acetyltransferase n=1 Tax=unclassified Streptomyces TaxID=2593676 RepID=UPI00341B5FD0
MTITITLPRLSVPAVTERGLRLLLPAAEPALLALADLCGVGTPVRLLGLGIKLVRSPTQD